MDAITAPTAVQRWTQKGELTMDNHCVCCGEIIPEGRQVCPICEKGNDMDKYDICDSCTHRPVCSIYRATGGVKNCGHHREERKGRWLPQWLLGQAIVDCSECKTIGSPHWKVCPVCEAKMVIRMPDIREDLYRELKYLKGVPRQVKKTIAGQIRAGDLEGAWKGIKRLKEKNKL